MTAPRLLVGSGIGRCRVRVAPRAGGITRTPNPGDRRSVLIAASPKAEDEIRDTLAAMHGRMIDVVRPMTSADRASVIGFLRAMQEAVDEIDR